MIRKLPDGRYRLDFYPLGSSGPRVVRVRDTRRECKAIEAEYQALADRGVVAGRDGRLLSDLVRLWYKVHGCTLRDAKYRLSRTLAVADSMGDPPAYRFSAAMFADYRDRRLGQVSISTLNHETRYLRAVFSELIRLDLYSAPNPMSKVRTFPEQERELCYLASGQIESLLVECDRSTNNHCGAVARLCLATGARWNEANGLAHRGLLDDRVVYSGTKNGKVRVVPVRPDLVGYIRSLAFPQGDLFAPCYGAFRKAVERSGIQLPPGQLSHVLRHTFASHYIQNGGDILALQRILGHSSLKITMRYAHLAPDYLASVPDLSPLNGNLIVSK